MARYADWIKSKVEAGVAKAWKVLPPSVVSVEAVKLIIIMRIRNPTLQDFARSFLHRSYHLNPVIAKYRSEVSELCTFCKRAKETITHVYWDCPIVKPLWDRVQMFIYENISEDCQCTQAQCLLSDFDCSLLVLLAVIVKYRIFLARLNEWNPEYIHVINALKWERDIHLHCTSADNLKPYYELWGTLISDKIFEDEISRYRS